MNTTTLRWPLNATGADLNRGHHLSESARPARVVSREAFTPKPESLSTEFWLGGLVVIGVHVLVMAAWHLPTAANSPAPPTVIELLRPPPLLQEVAPPPPPPPPPPKQAPRVSTQPPVNAVAPPALRTPEAVAQPAADAVTIAENTIAAPTTAPVQALPPAAPPAPPVPPPVEEPLVEATAYAAYLKNPPPRYPEMALRQGWQGRVVLRVYVLANGRADTVEIRQSSGRKALDEAALAAVREWTFQPARRGAQTVAAWAVVPVEFKLN